MTAAPPDLTAGGGQLVLVATPIGNLGDLSARAAAVLADADVVCCEDTRHTGRLLERAGIKPHRLMSLHAHNEESRIAALIAELDAGRTIAVVSDAGTPLVSDPGSRLVAAAIAAGHRVSTVPGPSAVLGALVVSGFDVGRFRFEGFLPRAGRERSRRIDDIAAADVPTVLYESPKRLAATLSDLAARAGDERRVVVVRELTKLHEEVWRGRLDEAIALAVGREPIGEHVVVVDAAPGTPRPGVEAARRAIRELVAAGLEAKDATRAVEVLLDVPHRVAYEAALEVRDETRLEAPADPERPGRRSRR